MKSMLVLPVVIVAVAVAAVLHMRKDNKSKEETGIEKLATGFKALKQQLPAAANLTFRTIDVDAEVYLWGRYLLAYPYGVADNADKFDTVLTVCGQATSDSVLHIITDQKKVLWSGNDDEYRYFLTCKQ